MGEAATAAAKRAVRARMRVVRAEIAADPAERARRSAAICERLAHLVVERAAELPGTLRVLLYAALASEPDLSALRASCDAHDVAFYAPRVIGDDLAVDPGDVDPSTLDVVVVPGLAFTTDGRRLGQGGGHFDRFLPRVRGDCTRVGVAFAEQVLADLPTENHDARVHVVITDRSMFEAAEAT